jgi:hypothetical protein
MNKKNLSAEKPGLEPEKTCGKHSSLPQDEWILTSLNRGRRKDEDSKLHCSRVVMPFRDDGMGVYRR